LPVKEAKIPKTASRILYYSPSLLISSATDPNAAVIPSDNVKFSKQAESIVEEEDGTVTLGFKDGSKAVADVGESASIIPSFK
jgi:hypothetical protein